MSELFTCSYYNHRINVNTNIPDELIVEILKWLPAKSLLRFMCACRSWYNLISSPNFKSTHLNHQIDISKETRFLIYNYAIFYYDTYIIYCDDHDFSKHFDLICKESEAIPIGYCDGVVCLIDNHSVYLWNPSLRTYLALRIPHKTNLFGNLLTDIIHRNLVFGFGFDASTNDYKVVCVAYLRCTPPNTKSVGVYVYSLNSGSWRVVDDSFSWDDECKISTKSMYFNGVIHWLVERNDNDDDDDDDDDRFIPGFILTFDLTEETFSEIKLPKGRVDVPRVSDSDLNHRVELMILKRNGRDFLAALQSDPESIELWVMNSDDGVQSWREVFSITRDVGYRCFENVTMNGELVMKLKEGSMVLLNPTTMKMKRISNRKMNYVGTYVESLVLLKAARESH